MLRFDPLHPLDQQPPGASRVSKVAGADKNVCTSVPPFQAAPIWWCVSEHIRRQPLPFATAFATVLPPAGTLSARNH